MRCQNSKNNFYENNRDYFYYFPNNLLRNKNICKLNDTKLKVALPQYITSHEITRIFIITAEYLLEINILLSI